MRGRTRAAIRPALLVLLLLGVFSTRLSSGFGLESISSFDRLVDHPGQYLEGGLLANSAVTHKHFFFGSRRFKMLSNEDSLQGGVSRFKGSSATNTFSDGGGSLQLCLLLVFCVAVLCCASMSISPWYKSENFLLRKTMAVLNAAAALVTESLGGADASQPEGGEGSIDGGKAPNQGGRGGNSQSQPPKSAKKAGKKKRKSGSHFMASQPGHRATGDRGLEKTLSNSSGGEAGSEVSGDTDLGSAPDPPASPRGGRTAHANPADIQIARIEAEAARQRELRASKLKKTAAQKAEKQAENAPPEPAAKPKKDEKEGAPERPVRSAIPVKPLEKGAADKGRRVVERAVPVDDRYRRGGPPSTASSEGKRPVLAKGMENGDPRDRLARRVAGGDKPTPLQSQVLVVPRRQAVRGKARPQERLVSEEDALVAPQTPERSTSNASTFSSPHSSVFSPHHLSRPYAQVARGDLPLTAVPPPPPPPPRLAALPPGAVYAREFIPAVQGSSANGSGSLGDYGVMSSQHIHVSAGGPSPLQLPEPLSPTSSSVAQTSSPSPSPFPGMSLHRRLVPASPPPATHTTSLDLPQSSNNSYTSSSAFRGLGFPGTFDNIWSTSAVRPAGEASWLSTEATSQSQHHSWESEKGLGAASEGLNLPRLESW